MLPKEFVTNALTLHGLHQILPGAPHKNILHYGPLLLTEIGKANHWGTPRFPAYCLSTIAAEVATFDATAGEGGSHHGSKRPFGRYDSQPNKLGNTTPSTRMVFAKIYSDYVDPKDGENYRGRGFIQLTGRANYLTYGARLHLDLLNHPELAAVPQNSVHIFISYIVDRWQSIGRALSRGDLRTARAAVNGGSNGLPTFIRAYCKVMDMTAPSEAKQLRRWVIERLKQGQAGCMLPNDRGFIRC
jgi:putative chitinase